MSQLSMEAPGRRRGSIGRWPGRRAAAAVATVAAMIAVFAATAGAALPQVHRGAGPAGRGVAGAGPADAGLLPSDTVLQITFLDVGQGDAVLLRAPEGQTALVDAGPGDVVPLLRAMGVERIDLLVASHPHADHIGGMARVIEEMPVRFYMDNGDPHTTATYRRLLAALDARPGITYLEAVPRTISLGSAEIEVLPLLPRGTADLNNRSVPLLVRFGTFTALLSGDSEVRQLTDLVGRGAVPRLTLLKAPHHGSDNGFTADFLRVARPGLVVISVGRNSYGHPRPAALAAYAAAGASVMRTDMHGHVAIRGHRSGAYEVGGEVAGGVAGAGEAGAVVGAGAAVGGRSAAGGGPAAAVVGAGATVRAGAAAAGALRLAVHADAPGNDNRNPNGEYAVVENRGDGDLAIGGWTLCDAAGHCFRFPAGSVIAAGGAIVVHTGIGTSDGRRFYMGMRRAVWNNGGDTATLSDPTGAVVVSLQY